jgi:general secretion pathway protein F
MPVFEYKAFDSAGKAVAGIVDADTAKVARGKLRRQGIFPTEVHQQKAGVATKGQGLNVQVDFSKYFQRVGSKDIVALTSQLSTLIGASVPMVESLSAIIDQVENPALRLVLVQVRDEVNQGSSLAAALKKHPKIFSDLYCNMVAAGEQSGAMDVVLKRLAAFTESQEKLRSKVVASLTYPVLMGGVALLVVVGLFVGVIPKMRRIFDSFGEALPWITRAILFISDTTLNYWWAMLLVVAVAVVGFRKWLATPNGRKRSHAWALKAPIFGRMNRMVAVSRFCRTLSTLLDSGVPILTAVAIVQTVVENDVLAEAIGNAGKNIREGQSIAGPLKESGEFPPLVTHMIAIGERTGELEPMLAKVADAYDSEVDNMLAALTSLLEPILIVVLGGVVAVVALSILLPMLNMSNLAH